jgi:hypothetical protein
MWTSRAMISGLALAAVATTACTACGGKGKDDTVVDDRPARRATLSWGMTKAPPKGDVVTRTEVFLGITDETGKAVSYPLGVYDGECVVLGALPQYSALTAVSCTNNGAGFQLHANGNRSEIVVLRMPIREGVEPDPLARDQLTTIPVPLGAKIEAAP